MNKPSSTIQAAGYSGMFASMIFLMLAILAPDIYQRAQAYPGAEATIAAFLTTLFSFLIGWRKRENVLPVKREFP